MTPIEALQAILDLEDDYSIPDAILYARAKTIARKALADAPQLGGAHWAPRPEVAA